MHLEHESVGELAHALEVRSDVALLLGARPLRLGDARFAQGHEESADEGVTAPGCGGHDLQLVTPHELAAR